jgi:hypothetical protein
MLQFTASSVVSRPRNHHVTLVTPLSTGGWMLYAIAGVDANAPIANVDQIAINPDGSFGSWVADAPFPIAVGGAVGEVVSGVVVVAGGTSNSTVSDQAYSAVVQGDGSLGAWVPAGTVGVPRMHAGAISKDNTMWIFGGFDEQAVWSTIVSATVSSDGTVSSWQPAGTLPGPRSHFSVTMLGDYVYIAGGLAQSALNDPPDLQDVWVGQIQSDGTLGGWQQLTNLPIPLATHASFFYGGNLYVCGGITDTPAQSAACWQAPVLDDHTLGAFTDAAALRIARGHVHQMPVVAGQVYSIAGAIDFNLDSTTEIDIGSWSSALMPIPPPPPPPTPPVGPLRAGAAKCHAW